MSLQAISKKIQLPRDLLEKVQHLVSASCSFYKVASGCGFPFQLDSGLPKVRGVDAFTTTYGLRCCRAMLITNRSYLAQTTLGKKSSPTNNTANLAGLAISILM